MPTVNEIIIPFQVSFQKLTAGGRILQMPDFSAMGLILAI